MVRKAVGPGPGKYMLPSVIGYKDHDVRKYRNPQYSMGSKLGLLKKQGGPGPCYLIEKMTNYGKLSPPAFTMKSRPNPLKCFQTPGPGTYKPELVPRMNQSRPPKYSIAFRHPPLKKYNTPGPNQYEVPSTIGPKVPDLHANAAYSMAHRVNLLTSCQSPGPAKYSGIDTNIYRNKLPKYTMPGRVFPPGKSYKTPGPIYLPKLPTIPGYSLGLKTDQEPYITADDEMPCATKTKIC